MKATDIVLTPQMYKSKKTLTDQLSEMQIEQNPFLEGLDAFEQQLKRFDIKVSGDRCDCLEAFFKTSQSCVLLPEFIRRKVEQGMEENNIVEQMIAVKTVIDGYDYRGIEATTGEKDSVCLLEKLNIKTQEYLARIWKRGKLLTTSYESLRFQKISLFAGVMCSLGRYIRTAQLKDIAHTIVECEPLQTNHSLQKLSFYSKANGLNCNTIIANPDTVFRLTACYGVDKDSRAFGMKIVAIDSSELEDKKFIAFNSDSALEMVTHGIVEMDYDKIMNKQFESAKIVYPAGFSVIDSSSVIEGVC